MSLTAARPVIAAAGSPPPGDPMASHIKVREAWQRQWHPKVDMVFLVKSHPSYEPLQLPVYRTNVSGVATSTTSTLLLISGYNSEMALITASSILFFSARYSSFLSSKVVPNSRTGWYHNSKHRLSFRGQGFIHTTISVTSKICISSPPISIGVLSENQIQ